MILLGITGAIGHGKSSLAAALQHAEPNSLHLESFYVIAEVVDALHKELKTVPPANDLKAINQWFEALPDILQQVVHTQVDFQKLAIRSGDMAENPVLYQKLFQYLEALTANPDLAKSKITDTNKPSYRAILQWVGGYMVEKVGSKLWWDELIRRANTAFAEGKELVILGGVRYPGDADIIRHAGGKIIHIIRPDLPEPDTSDPTEHARQKIQADLTVINGGRLRDLEICARNIVLDFKNSQPQTRYVCPPKL